ncbi:hypothetical protein EYF80_025703 [Liparis tanakae]|uniref:Uncharacterized protein n=1 Tax=Liparis tanakae TaxID=230148 RepID=A0A4Z2HFL3_9TELE|nr:hypothetical protein EYF80_025703 [Liparis tanakae]
MWVESKELWTVLQFNKSQMFRLKESPRCLAANGWFREIPSYGDRNIESIEGPNSPNAMKHSNGVPRTTPNKHTTIIIIITIIITIIFTTTTIIIIIIIIINNTRHHPHMFPGSVKIVSQSDVTQCHLITRAEVPCGRAFVHQLEQRVPDVGHVVFNQISNETETISDSSIRETSRKVEVTWFAFAPTAAPFCTVQWDVQHICKSKALCCLEQLWTSNNRRQDYKATINTPKPPHVEEVDRRLALNMTRGPAVSPMCALHVARTIPRCGNVALHWIPDVVLDPD